MKTTSMEPIFGCWIPGTLTLLVFFAWLTHIIACFKAAAYLLLVAGAIFFPIGILHGIAIWLGLV